jgi:hypothetical protein
MTASVRSVLVIALGLAVACERSGPAPVDVASAGAEGAADTAVVPPAPVAAAPWPFTCDEAAARAIEKMGPAGEQRLRSLAKDELIVLHDSLGLNIRNGFGLWGENDALLASCTAEGAGTTADPDAVSMVIITRAWEMLHGERKAPHGGH